MFSERFKSICFFSIDIATFFGGTALSVDKSTLTFHFFPKAQRRVYLTFSLALLWGALSFLLIYKRRSDTENLFVTTAYSLGYISALTMYSFQMLSGKACCSGMNLFIQFLTQLKGSFMQLFVEFRTSGTPAALQHLSYSVLVFIL